MEPNTTQNSTSSNGNKRKNIIIASIITLLVIIALVITLVFVLKGDDDDTETIVIEGARQDTPTLQIFALLNDGMTLAEMETAAKAVDAETTITYEDDYRGYIEIPGYSDYVSFDIDTLQELTGEEYYEENAPPVEYEQDDLIFNIVYALYDGDYGYSINYSEVDEEYFVSDPYDVNAYGTKQQAIDAYLGKTSN